MVIMIQVGYQMIRYMKLQPGLSNERRRPDKGVVVGRGRMSDDVGWGRNVGVELKMDQFNSFLHDDDASRRPSNGGQYKVLTGIRTRYLF